MLNIVNVFCVGNIFNVVNVFCVVYITGMGKTPSG